MAVGGGREMENKNQKPEMEMDSGSHHSRLLLDLRSVCQIESPGRHKKIVEVDHKCEAGALGRLEQQRSSRCTEPRDTERGQVWHPSVQQGTM